MAMAQAHQAHPAESSNDNGGVAVEAEMPLVLHRSYWLTPQAVRSITLVEAQFQPRPDDVILATFPKSGTTWLKALVFAIANRARHPAAAAAAAAGVCGGHPLLTTHPQDLVPFLELPDRELRPLAADLALLTSPRLLSTHMPLALLPPRVAAAGCRVVYLCRDPKDVLVSTWHFMNKVSHGLSIRLGKYFELFCQGLTAYGPTWEHNLGYWNEHTADPDRVLFMKYEDMMANPSEHVRKLADFLRVPFTGDEERGGVVEEVVRLCSFEWLASLPVNSSGMADRIGGWPMENSSYFREGKVGDWKNYLTEEMASSLDCIVAEKLKGSGLTF